MEVKGQSPYIPKSRIRELFLLVKTDVAYRVWRRKLHKYAGFDRHSNFKMLDVGCGPGYLLRCFETWFPESILYGLDNDKSIIEFTSHTLKRTTLIHHDGHNLPFPDNEFDLITSLQALEHLEKPETLVKEAWRVLKLNGFFILSTPNPNGIPAKVLKKNWPGYRYDHISLKNPRDWHNIIVDSGFVVLDEGSTAIAGFRLLQIFPFALLNWIPMALFGYFPWDKGESYMMIARKCAY